MKKKSLRYGLLCGWCPDIGHEIRHQPGSGTGMRKMGFSQALQAASYPSPQYLDYGTCLRTPEKLVDMLGQIDVLRIDSPGGGYDLWSQFAKYYDYSMDAYSDQNGRIYPQKPYYDGTCATINMATRVAKKLKIACTVDANAVSVFMDKLQTHKLCQKNGLPVPHLLPLAKNNHVKNYMELCAAMDSANIRKVFMKPFYGSAASGVVAIEKFGTHVRARTSVELVEESDKILLFNSLKLKTYLDKDAVQLINHVAALGVIVEKWIPKFKLDDKPCDLRLLVIGGKPAHAVVRMSDTPITNLHLGNVRTQSDALRAAMPPTTWDKIVHIGEQAGALFPNQFCIGIDIAVHENAKDIFVLEINAFGDQLHDVFHDGLSPYAYQIKHFPDWIHAKQERAA